MLSWLQALDGNILLWLQEVVRGPILTVCMIGYTTLGDAGILWIALSFVMLCFRPTRRGGALALGAMLLGALCTNVVLKHLVARPRPWLMVEGLVHLIEEGDPNSFPSGHTTAAFASCVVWFRTLPWKWGRVTALVAAVGMGFSRLYVGVHYPSDVLGGMAVGTLCAMAVLALAKRYRFLERDRDQTLLS